MNDDKLKEFMEWLKEEINRNYFIIRKDYNIDIQKINNDNKVIIKNFDINNDTMELLKELDKYSVKFETNIRYEKKKHSIIDSYIIAYIDLIIW